MQSDHFAGRRQCGDHIHSTIGRQEMDLCHRFDLVRCPGSGVHARLFDDHRERELHAQRRESLRGACVRVRQPVRRFFLIIWRQSKVQRSFSSALARKLTYALAASFQEYSKRVKALELSRQQDATNADEAGASRGATKKFAIDLRTPEEMQQDIDEQETEA